MKQFTNHFNALVELTNVGRDLVAVKVTTSMNVAACDRSCIASLILDRLIPDYVVYRPLYDGGFILTSLEKSTKYASVLCISTDPATLEFNAGVELEDGLIHDVHFTLEKSDSLRRDFCVCESRSIILRGSVTVDVEDNEAPKE